MTETYEPLLSVRRLVTEFPLKGGGVTRVVDGVDFELQRSERVALVGESGSGKSLTVRSILNLVPSPGRVAEGSVRFRGQELVGLPPHAMSRLRGGRIALVFQDPMTSWNPVKRVGAQIREALKLHGRGHGARERVVRLLDDVGIPSPIERANAYPHQFSGGMRQRGMIAMGLANEPDLLIADEPTTALDVTVQDQIIRLLRELSERSGTALLLITHNLALVASLCERVMVLYAGRIVESGPTQDIFDDPQHPYTYGLLRSVPRLDQPRGQRLVGIPGQPAQASDGIGGCKFHPRCPYKIDRCETDEPELAMTGDRAVRCWVTMRHVGKLAP